MTDKLIVISYSGDASFSVSIRFGAYPKPCDCSGAPPDSSACSDAPPDGRCLFGGPHPDGPRLFGGPPLTDLVCSEVPSRWTCLFGRPIPTDLTVPVPLPAEPSACLLATTHVCVLCSCLLVSRLFFVCARLSNSTSLICIAFLFASGFQSDVARPHIRLEHWSTMLAC